MNRDEQLAKAVKTLMLKDPFYGLLLMSLERQWDKRVPTACVGIKGINYFLKIGPDFWDELDLDKRLGILKHELLHIGMFHLVNYDHLKDKEKANIAMDLEINQYIPRNQLPAGGCFLDSFPELNLEPKAGTNYYYKQLTDPNNQDKPSMQALNDAIKQKAEQAQMPNGSPMDMPGHEWEKEGQEGPMSEAQKKMLHAQTEHIIKQVAEQVQKSRGVIPGEFAEILEKINTIEPPKFDWRGYVRRFAGRSIKLYTKKTRRKESIRIKGNPGLRLKQRKHILAGIDTSGSVSTAELKEFLHEMHHLKKTGNDVTVLQFDTQITDIKEFNPRHDFTVKGRGGTCFQPGTDYYRENIKNYSCYIVFTDGEAPPPENAPKDILWVVSSRGDKSYLDGKGVGAVIQLDK